MYRGIHVKHPLFFSEFNEILIFLADLLKTLKRIMKILPFGAELCHSEEGQTVVTTLIVAFRSSTKASQNVFGIYSHYNGSRYIRHNTH